MNVTEETFKSMDMSKYAEDYSENDFWSKSKSAVKKLGIQTLYKALQLYYVAKDPNCPPRIKAAILATLGYFISPMDLIPDITPVVGFSDDMIAISFALTMAQLYITEEIKLMAKERLADIFGNAVLKEIC